MSLTGCKRHEKKWGGRALSGEVREKERKRQDARKKRGEDSGKGGNSSERASDGIASTIGSALGLVTEKKSNGGVSLTRDRKDRGARKTKKRGE